MSPSLLFGTIGAFMCISMGRLLAAETIGQCEMMGQYLADKNSCTRYHICRMDDTGILTTDIAICTATKVFDMVTTSCQEVGKGFLQDPAGCRTYYGCHKSRKNSEGYIRRHFKCPGDLRFHPLEKHCTFKTMVPDSLCNSKSTLQQIIGEKDLQATTASTAANSVNTSISTTAAPETSSDSSPSTSTSTSEPPARDAGSGITIATDEDSTSSVNTETTNNPVIITAASPKNPASITDIERITQVIKGQLLNRRPVINNQVSLKPSTRD